MKEDLMDNISVIIRNRNEAEFIGFAIQSCLDHLNNPEIIIVNDQNIDDSLETVKLFNNRLKIKIIQCQNYSPGKSINLGVTNSDNDYILILSGHSQITQIGLPGIKKDLEEYSAVFGKQVPIYKGKKITPRYIWSHFTDEKEVNMYSQIEDRCFFHNAFSFFKRETLLKYPFDETLPGKEDRYWAKDMVALGKEYLYSPQNIINHFYTKNGATWKGIG
jgi:glycosyltransferase involved in cell wall biosynthesis